MPYPVKPLPSSSMHTLRRRQLMFGAFALVCSPPILAQNSSEPDAPEPADVFPLLQGQTVDGQPLALSDLKGQVVLVFHWSTGCAVCRDKMHEMRANVAGWVGRPFQLLGVNWDTQRNDLVNYESLLRQTVPPEQRLQSIWAGDEHFQSSMPRPDRLPMSHLIDPQGRLRKSHSGRIPPETWDLIASML